MKIQRVIFAWSESDVHYLQPGDAVVPLTAEAHVAAVKLQAAPILDPRIYLGDTAGVRDNATQLLNALHESLKASPFPWFEAYANIIFHMKAFQLIAWLRLIRALQRAFHPSTLEICLPTGFTGDLFIYRLAQRSFDLARDILQREGVRFSGRLPSTSIKTRLRRKALVGWGVARLLSNAPRLHAVRRHGGSRRPSDRELRQQKTEVVLVSQQYTDAFHATPLAGQLKRAFGDRFLWVGMLPQVTPGMTTEEADLVAGVNLKELRFLDSASLENGADPAHRKAALVDLGSAWRVAGLLALTTGLGVTRGHWFDFLMDPEFRGLGSRYELWSRFLDEVGPKVVVALSSLQDMALVRAWARRHRVPFVEFMHGVFPAVDSSYHVDADYLGVFGQVHAEQVDTSRLPRPRRVVACGAMQFGDKAKVVSGGEVDRESPSAQQTVLFLGGFEWLPFCPWSPADMWTMVRDIHQVCCDLGKVLRVRAHPRNPVSVLLPYVDVLREQRPETIVLSVEPSIQRDLSSAELVVAPGFDGAVLDALLEGRLVMCYVPEGVKIGTEMEPFERMGVMAYGYAALKELFAAIVRDPGRAAELRLIQSRFLRSYIGDLEHNPWRRALDLVNEGLRGSGSPDDSRSWP